MKTDIAIKHDVEAELHWEPQVDDTDISVKINNGVVTLTGFVSSYAQKYRAGNAAKRISGVTALANDIEVRLTPADGIPDPQLARDAVAALKADHRVEANLNSEYMGVEQWKVDFLERQKAKAGAQAPASSTR